MTPAPLAFQRRTNPQARTPKDGGKDRGQDGGSFRIQAVATVGDHIFQVSPCGPTGRAAEIAEGGFGHEEQHMRVLLRSDLQAA